MAYVLAFMFIVGGAVFGLLGYANLVSVRRKRAAWLPLEGTVVDFAEQTGDKGRTLYAPVYRYTFDGNHYTATSKVASFPPRYTVGDPIPLIVNPVRSNDAEVADAAMRPFTYGLLVMGVLVLALGVFLAWLAFTGQMKLE